MDEATDNPFKAPDADEHTGTPSMDSDADNYELIRKQHINTETNVKGLSSLILLGSVFTFFSLFTLSELRNSPNLYGMDDYINVIMGMAIVQGVLLFISGLKLRKMQAIGAKLYAVSVFLGFSTIFIDMNMLDIPSDQMAYVIGQHVGGMIIPLLILGFLFSKKARYVYTDEYRLKVIPATPHVKYKSPWLILLIIIIVIVAFVGYAAAQR